MVAYIIKLAGDIGVETAPRGNGARLFNLMRVLPEELDRLDPRDFAPSAQYDFVMARQDARALGRLSHFSDADRLPIQDVAARVVAVLEHFGGDGSQVCSRQFPFIVDPDLRRIIERDYRELRVSVFPSRAWKSSVILAGSILEAILFDQLANPALAAQALASGVAPKSRGGPVRPLEDWKLADLIRVAADISLLPAGRAPSIDQVLRDYRNFVHPKKEIRAEHPCSEAEAMMSLGALDGVCNLLS